MTNRYLLLITAASLSLTGNAKQISGKQAALVAKKYTTAAVQQKRLQSIGSQASAPYYAFNLDKGFIIVSGDDELTELVGYSDRGSFDSENMAPQLREWLGQYSAYVKAVQNGSAKAVQTKAEEATVVVSPLLTTKWNQGTPFNNLCPLLSSSSTEHCATGCAATAMAQVFNYHEWPDTGVGSVTYTDDTYGTMTMDFSQSTYDWANMADSYNSTYTDDQANAVAKLMVDCGYALNMDYGSESGAVTNAYYNAENYFKYDVEIYDRNGYSTIAFSKIITDELDNSRPVIYTGQGTSGGHAFVADGYDSNKYLHINWGWGGVSDGYFNMNYMDPNNVGTGGGTGAFDKSQSIATFKPLRNGETAESMAVLGYAYGTDRGVWGPTESFSTSTDATFQLGNIYSMGQAAFTGTATIGFFTADGDTPDATSKTVYKLENVGTGSYYATKLDFTTNLSALKDGIYYAYGIYKASDGNAWIKFNSKLHVVVTISNGTATVTTPTCDLILEDGSITTSSSPEIGKSVKFNVAINNSSDLDAFGNITYSVTKKSDNTEVTTGTVSSAIYDNNVYNSAISVKLTASMFTVGETYNFNITDISDSEGTTVNFQNTSSGLDFTVVEAAISQDQLKFTDYNSTTGGFEFSSESFDKSDESATMEMKNIINPNSDSYTGYVGYNISQYGGSYNTDVAVGSVSDFANTSIIPSVSINVKNMPIPGLSSGAYCIKGISKQKVGTEWEADFAPFANADEYAYDFRINDSGTVTVLHPEATIQQTDAITTTGKAMIGQTITFHVPLENLNNKTVTGTVQLEVKDALEEVVDYITADATIAPYSSTMVDVEKKITSSVFKDGEAYTVGLSSFATTDGTTYSLTAGDTYEMNAVTSGINDIAVADIKVYPNPVADELHTNVVANRISIVSANGAIAAQAANANSISVSALAPGYYIAVVTTADGTIRRPFIKK